MDNIRKMVYQGLLKLEKSAYSDTVIDQMLSESSICKRDKAFATVLFYGVLSKKLTLDYQINLKLKNDINKLSNELKTALRMGVYQLFYMDSVPDNAAVNETVELIKYSKQKAKAGFVNAVLWNIIREGKKLHLPVEVDNGEYMSIKYSINKDLVNMWTAHYGLETTNALLKKIQLLPTVYIRVNEKLIDKSQLLDSIKELGLNCQAVDFLDNAISLEKIGDLIDSTLYKNGFFHVQDLSSQIVSSLCAQNKDANILDLCASPGGKTFTTAQMVSTNATITSCDISQNKVAMIDEGVERLKLSNVTTMVNDAATLNNDFVEKFDTVLCDVPCSGYGIIRKKPEIKYKNLDDQSNLPEKQYQILLNGAKYLKKDGRLIYSTCTLNKKENEKIVSRFLEQNPNFTGIEIDSNIRQLGLSMDNHMLTFMPLQLDMDGFFVAVLKRVK